LSTLPSAQQEIASGQRFAFGRNWRHFLQHLDEDRIRQAEASLKDMLGCKDLRGRRFLDIGSGSGLFSLAARRLGAQVLSFDFDPQSVACTAELKRRYFAADSDWKVEHGSVLDAEYMQSLGQHDIVYSWGVLHHTGHLDLAVRHAIGAVAEGGQAFIALYNAQPLASRYWTFVKRSYNRWPVCRPAWIALHWLYPTLPGVLLRALQGRAYPRGMSVWHDLLDWLGGYPFEVRSPEQVLDVFRAQGFDLTRLKTVGGKMGCNEFVFQRR
jgi:2-polyprenyl-6-hydroxyphenyl methylase/3-demethylubiquinone-9 3-methyltransferase